MENDNKKKEEELWNKVVANKVVAPGTTTQTNKKLLLDGDEADYDSIHTIVPHYNFTVIGAGRIPWYQRPFHLWGYFIIFEYKGKNYKISLRYIDKNDGWPWGRDYCIREYIFDHIYKKSLQNKVISDLNQHKE